MNPNIYVIDEIMGKGKTSAAINYINQSSDNERFLIITPYVTEIQRYITCCKGKHFVEPYNRNKTKLASIKELIGSGENIVSTHALFQKFDEEVIYLCNLFNYTLIMDEVADVVEDYKLGEKDLNILRNSHCIEIDEDTGKVTWVDDNYGDIYEEGRFDDVRNLCNFGSLFYCGGKLLVWLFPVETFKAFKNVYIMTYMFDVQIQKYYYDYYGLKYTKMYIHGNSMDNYHYATVPDTEYKMPNYKELIHIVDMPTLNDIGDKQTSLSSTWYKRYSKTEVMKQLKNKTYNFYRNITGSNSDNFIWCTFTDYFEELKGNGYRKRFVAINTRATNLYKDCHNVAYLVNRYLRPPIKNFFTTRGVEVDEDGYALSEMLQFIWRSAIRECKPIELYIPSSRMRGLLKQWIEENSNQ